VSSARYSRPLDTTAEKKFRAMNSLAELFVIGFSTEVRFRKFTENTHLYLLPHLPFPILRYFELLVLGQVILFWLIVRSRIEIVVTQSVYEGVVTLLPLKVAAWLGYKVRLVVEAHGDFEQSLFLYRRVRLGSVYRLLMNQAALYSLTRADSLRAISNFTKDQLQRWAPTKPIVQFPAWTDIETFLQSGLDRPHQPQKVILYAGVLTPLKGIHHLINAFSSITDQFPGEQLLIIGKEENRAYAAGLREQARDLGLENRIRFIAHCPQSELAVWMAKSAVLVLPSISEGLGRVVIEAMATGTPVIGSRVGGIPELIENGARGFLVPPGDENAIANKLRWVLSNPDTAREMGIRARDFAQRLFSTQSYLEGYRNVFEMAQSTIELREHAPSTL